MLAIKKEKESILYTLILIYLTCYFMQLFGFPDLLMLVLGAVFCLILLLKQKKFRVDLGVCLIAITMFSYCIVVFGIRAIAIMMPYIPVVIYVLAHYVAKEIKGSKNAEIKLTYVIYCLVLGHAIYGILNSWTYFAGYRWEGTRAWMDIWSRDIIPGTQLTVYYLTVFAMLFPAIIYFYKRKVINICIIAVTLFFIYSSLATRTRTTLLVLAIVFCVQAAIYAILEREKVMKNVTPKKIGVFLCGVLATCIVLVFVLKDNEIIKIFIDNLDKGGGILNNIRFVVQRQALSQLFEYPMGGNQMVMDLKLAHNVWLDMANTAGLIPFFAFTIYSLWTIYELIRFIAQKGIHTEIKLMMAGIYLAFFLYYTVEPALNSSIHFITPWLLVNGLVHGYISNKA